jgi:hypothetical protein
MLRTLASSLLLLFAVPALAAGPAGPQTLPSKHDVISYTTIACLWSPPIKESAGVEFKCAGGTMMIGVKHSGDENGDTRYQCCALSPQPVEKLACAWSESIRESNSLYNCPGHQLMAGRKHTGDENGFIRYYCCNLHNPAGQVLPVDSQCEWVGPQQQSASDLSCKANQVMRGRQHSGDENGNTSIFCCNVEGKK